MSSWPLRAFVWALAICAATPVLAQTIATYQARHRPAAELERVAASAMGADGTVALDARTATLVLNGSATSVQRALRLLEQLDRLLRQVVLRQEIRELDAATEAAVTWRAELGPVRIGIVDGRGVEVALSAGSRERRSSSHSMLRLSEGGSGYIAAGRALPVLFAPYWGASYERVETGFEATAYVLGEGGQEVVQLELRPFAGRLEPSGELRYLGAATSITVRPGETLVVGEISERSATRDTSVVGAERTERRSEQVLLISVSIER